MVSAKECQPLEKPDIKGDRVNILILILMYLLQNIVFGLLQALPLVIQNRKVSYADQAYLSIISYPICFKLLWAPIVDCFYWKRFGRRKSWLVPMQYVMGTALLLTSLNFENWLGSDDGTKMPNIPVLTLVFFMCTLFTSIHDIALDAWTLTMVQRRNVGYAGTCSSVGGTIGRFISFILFIILDSKDFCNMFRSVPKEHGFISPAGFVLFWSIVMLASSTLMLIFKKDNSLDVIEDSVECKLGFKDSYLHLYRVLKVKPIQICCFILLTNKIGFGPTNGVAPLKLIDVGVKQDKLVLLNIPAFPIQMILSVLLSRYIAGPRSMRTFIYIYVLKLAINVVLALLIAFTPQLKDVDNSLPLWYYAFLLGPIRTMENVMKYLMGIAQNAFMLRISDPRFGGMYLTLLNTVNNIGAQWPITLSLWATNLLTIKHSTGNNEEVTVVDGLLTETVICVLIAILWLFWGKKQTYELEDMDPSLWVAKQKVNAAKAKFSSMLSSELPTFHQ